MLARCRVISEFHDYRRALLLRWRRRHAQLRAMPAMLIHRFHIADDDE